MLLPEITLTLAAWLAAAGAAPAAAPTPAAEDAEPRHLTATKTTLPREPVEVPMERARHMPAVEIRINGGGPYRFAIDTGAAGTLRVSASLVERLRLPRVGEVRGGDPSGLNSRLMSVVGVDTVEIGSARFEGLEAVMQDGREGGMLDGTDGIVGFGLFADCLVTLDYPGHILRLERGALPVDNGRDVLPFRSERGIPSVTVKIAGRELEADVDTGGMGGLILPESEVARLTLASELEVVGKARTTSNSFEIKAATLDGDASIGGLTLTRPLVTFQPLFPMATIGARVLGELVITFDSVNHRMRIAPGARGRPAPAAPAS